MECARALGVAVDEKLAVVPAERAGTRGLYLYTDRSAHFLALGAPHAAHGEAHEFLLRTSISAVGDIYLVFRDRAPGSGAGVHPAVGYQTEVPMKETLAAYRYAPAAASPGETAIDPLRRKLKERIGAVARFLHEKHRFSSPAEAKAALESDRLAYRARLEQCRIAGDRILGAAVDEELQKLGAGFAVVTVWEKQVGGRATAGDQR